MSANGPDVMPIGMNNLLLMEKELWRSRAEELFQVLEAFWGQAEQLIGRDDPFTNFDKYDKASQDAFLAIQNYRDVFEHE